MGYKYDHSKNIPNFENSVIVIDDMGQMLNKEKADYFAERRHNDIQLIVMCHKAAQIINTARMSCDTIYITTYNGADLFKIFNDIYKCDHKFYEITSDLKSSYYNCTDGWADDLRYGIIKYSKKQKTFIIIDKIRTMIY